MNEGKRKSLVRLAELVVAANGLVANIRERPGQEKSVARPGTGQHALSIEGYDEVLLECSRHNPVAQTVATEQVALRAGGTCLFPVQLRNCWARRARPHGEDPPACS